MQQSLQNDAVLLRLLLQLLQLLRSCFRRVKVHLQTDGFEAYGYIF